MAFHDRVKVATATTGAGTLALGAPAAGFQAFAAGGVVTGESVSYAIEQGVAWEIGRGVYDASANTLTRSLVSSSTGALLNLDGTAAVFLTVTARDLGLIYMAASRTAGNVTAPAGNTFGNFDTGIDLTVRAKAGDVLDVGINGQAGDGATDRGTIEWNFALLNGTTETNWAAGAVGSSTTIGSWTIRSGSFFGQSAALRYVVKAADVSAAGTVTVRLKVRTDGSTNGARVVFASAGVPFFWDVRNLGTPAA